MKRCATTLLAAWAALAAAAPGADPARPNLVVILADDMGYSDLGCYGGEIRTPNLDRLAAGGVRFSQFYNCALCGPSRAAVMTGLHPSQVGIFNWTGKLNQRCVTLFELLKRAGYTTGAVGRLDMVTAEDWHDPACVARHVDRFLRNAGGGGPGHYSKAVRTMRHFRNGQPYTLPAEGIYKTDLITDFAVEFIAEAAANPRPFFLYVAEYAPHWPLHAKPDDMARYRALYRELGWDRARADRHRRLIELGLIDSRCPLAPRDARVPPWTDAPHKDWEAERMAAFAAQVDSLDQSVGRILEALRKANADTNTLVLFLSDNGASDQPWPRPLDKPDAPWRLDGTPTRVGNTPDIAPGGPDTFVTAGPAWANVSNTPFRGHKAGNFEGGIATPLIASWPGVTRQPGVIRHEPGHITDIAATCLDAAGVAYPTGFDGRTLLPIEGRSLVPVLKGETRAGHESICWATGAGRAIRVAQWKLVAEGRRPWELHDLSDDRAESRDLAPRFPDKVRNLAAQWQQWAQRCGADRGDRASGRPGSGFKRQPGNASGSNRP